jgi:hypothetical protein
MPLKHTASSSSLLTLNMGRGSIGCCLALVMALLLLGACSAGADTINLEVSPSHPRRSESMTITASGISSVASAEVSVGTPPAGEQCPSEYPNTATFLKWPYWTSGERVEQIGMSEGVAPPVNYKLSFITNVESELEFQHPGTEICGYLTYFTEYGQATLVSTRLFIEYEEELVARYEEAPVTFLNVKTIAHPGDNSSYPGATKIDVQTNAYAHVTIALNHNAGIVDYLAPGKEGAKIIWSCSHPGLTYHYIVTATGGAESRLIHSGNFKTVSPAWCASIKRKEAIEIARESADRSPAQRAVEEELKHTYDIISYKEVSCNKLTNKRYKCHWSGWNKPATETGTLAKCANPSGTALVVFYKDGPEVTIDFLKKYEYCNYPY